MAQFPFRSGDNLSSSLMPRLPMLLTYGGKSIEVLGLLDTRATVNVLPYSVGLTLGAVWENQTTTIPLAGNLARVEARAISLMASHPQITGNSAVRLGFAWTQTDNAPLLFGQINFFLEFDVCFFRSQSLFDVRPKM